MKPFVTCLWFDADVEKAVEFYKSVFKDVTVGRIIRYSSVGEEIHGHKAGEVMTVEFEMNGMKFMALNGGPIFKPTEAVSIIISADTQDEIDYYWNALTADGGAPSACGWLKDKYGFSWQVAPQILDDMIADSDQEKSDRVMAAMLKMEKLNIAELERAFNG